MTIRTGADVWTLETERPSQFGGAREYARATPVKDVIEMGALWVLGEVTSVCRDLGLAVSDVMPNLSIHYTHGVTPAGVGDANDPLHMSISRRKAPAVYGSVIVAWKFMVVFVGDVPEHPALLTEGTRPAVSHG